MQNQTISNLSFSFQALSYFVLLENLTGRCLLNDPFSQPILLPLDPCLSVMPPCINEADRFSLEALRHIHKQLDDDNDGGIEVNESVEVSQVVLCLRFLHASRGNVMKKKTGKTTLETIFSLFTRRCCF